MSIQPEPQQRVRNKNNLHSFVIVALLAAGILGVYVPRMMPNIVNLGGGIKGAEEDGLTYVVDLDYWQKTDREKTISSRAHFDLDSDLNEIPLSIGEWQGEDVPQTNQEVQILLDPEQYVRRLYKHADGQYIWLSLIGGRSSKAFHAPDICYDADGWQYNLNSKAFTLNDGSKIQALWLEAQKQKEGQDTPTEHVVSYFYIFPNQDRNLADGIVLFKLTSNRLATIDETLELHADFVRSLFDQAR